MASLRKRKPDDDDRRHLDELAQRIEQATAQIVRDWSRDHPIDALFVHTIHDTVAAIAAATAVAIHAPDAAPAMPAAAVVPPPVPLPAPVPPPPAPVAVRAAVPAPVDDDDETDDELNPDPVWDESDDDDDVSADLGQAPPPKRPAVAAPAAAAPFDEHAMTAAAASAAGRMRLAKCSYEQLIRTFHSCVGPLRPSPLYGRASISAYGDVQYYVFDTKKYHGMRYIGVGDIVYQSTADDTVVLRVADFGPALVNFRNRWPTFPL